MREEWTMFQYGENPEETHAHQCSRCSFVWEHRGWQRSDLKAHTCSKCGALQFRRIGEPVQVLNAYGLSSEDVLDWQENQ
jgi:predicted  nucleic acid-binding Zn-ribbon protein